MFILEGDDEREGVTDGGVEDVSEEEDTARHQGEIRAIVEDHLEQHQGQDPHRESQP